MSATREHAFLDPDEYGAWNALLNLQRTALRALDLRLQAEVGLSVTEFDVLITLYNAEGGRLGMTALAQSVLLSPSGLTHLVTRLERDGLVARSIDPEDRRKFFSGLTPGGEERLRRARPIHNEVLRRELLAYATPNDRRVLVRLWDRIRAGQSSSGQSSTGQSSTGQS